MMSENDKRTIQRMMDTFDKGFDAYHPHDRRDWVAIRRLIKAGWVEECPGTGSCDTCGKENARTVMFTVAKKGANDFPKGGGLLGATARQIARDFTVRQIARDLDARREKK